MSFSTVQVESFLQQKGYEVKVKYWNLALRNVINHFWCDKYDDVKTSQIIKDLMPFYNYYAILKNDEEALLNIKQFLLENMPKIENIDKHLKNNKELLCDQIRLELKKMDIEQYSYLYVQSKFYKYQLVATGVLCNIVKCDYPSVTTIIEAQEFSRKALALMDSFGCYDFATWGEYELALTYILDELENGNRDYSSIPNIVYRDSFGRPHVSNKQIKEFIDLDTAPFADFSDYIEQTNVERKNIKFPLEGGRGCHWNGCSFCYMNDGYMYRRKSPERMRDEVRYYIDTYKAQLFYYIDNDIVGHDVKAFSQLLDYYAHIRKSTDFYIDFGEVIAHDLNAEVIEKMKDAGFLEIQIGYESTSDKMLEKIHKKSHFAHMLLTCRWCFQLGIRMSPQNILRSMPFETDELILDNIHNLYYLRFLLSEEGFCHSMRQLCVVSSSKYYPGFVESGKIRDWDYTPMKEFMVENFIKEDYRYDVFLMQTNSSNPLWNLFVETERFYESKRYSYEIRHTDGVCIFVEKQKETVIKQFVLSLLEQEILKACNRKVISLANLKETIRLGTEDVLEATVRELNKKGIVYLSDVYDEIVSLISF